MIFYSQVFYTRGQENQPGLSLSEKFKTNTNILEKLFGHFSEKQIMRNIGSEEKFHIKNITNSWNILELVFNGWEVDFPLPFYRGDLVCTPRKVAKPQEKVQFYNFKLNGNTKKYQLVMVYKWFLINIYTNHLIITTMTHVHTWKE